MDYYATIENYRIMKRSKINTQSYKNKTKKKHKSLCEHKVPMLYTAKKKNTDGTQKQIKPHTHTDRCAEWHTFPYYVKIIIHEQKQKVR